MMDCGPDILGSPFSVQANCQDGCLKANVLYDTLNGGVHERELPGRQSWLLTCTHKNTPALLLPIHACPRTYKGSAKSAIPAPTKAIRLVHSSISAMLHAENRFRLRTV